MSLCKNCRGDLDRLDESLTVLISLAKANGFCGWSCEETFDQLKNEQQKEEARHKAEWLLAKQAQHALNKKFYLTPEWRKLRYSVLQEFGSKCMSCGRTPEQGIEVHVDHIKPISKFPNLALDRKNLQVLCIDCNFGKSNIYEADHRPRERK